jgi:hypothetical protein
LVEIDLLRGGPRLPLHPPPQGDYCVLVSRAEERPSVDLWPIRLRDPLPEIPIPLRAVGESVPLNLQTILHRVYDAAGYGDYVYQVEPKPPLSGEDQRWAEDLLTRQGTQQP